MKTNLLNDELVIMAWSISGWFITNDLTNRFQVDPSNMNIAKFCDRLVRTGDLKKRKIQFKACQRAHHRNSNEYCLTIKGKKRAESIFEFCRYIGTIKKKKFMECNNNG